MNASLPPALHPPVAARDAVRTLRASRIREVANAGFGLPDVLPFWFGESDRVTPDFIRDAAAQALARGATFYTHNLGIAPLRSALADYVSRLHGNTSMEHVAVTSSGVNALMLAAQLVVGPGDRAVTVTPLWPNVVEIPKILGAHVETVSLDYGAHGWTLDVDKLLAALTPDTRLLTLNSPSNPTAGSCPAKPSRPCSRIAAGTASGSSPTKSTSASTTAAGPPRPHSSTSPSATNASSASTRSPSPG